MCTAKSKKRFKGFTLAELLISLVIIGELATFTIPKIITSQQNNSYNAKAKETASMIAAAYQQYLLQNGPSTNAGIKDLTSYLNYVSIDTVSNIDTLYTGTTQSCNGPNGDTCLQLHNGAYLKYWSLDAFGGNTTQNGIPFMIDPDGRVTDGTTNGPGKSLYFFLYYNGRVTDLGNITPSTLWNRGNWNPNPPQVPPWFSWN